MNTDAVALAEARSHYTTRARELEQEAYRSRDEKEFRRLLYLSRVARSAAMAEIVNRRPR